MVIFDSEEHAQGANGPQTVQFYISWPSENKKGSVVSMTRTWQCHSERFHIANGLACPEESLFMSSERSFCCTPAQGWKKRETQTPRLGPLCGYPSPVTDRSPDQWAQRAMWAGRSTSHVWWAGLCKYRAFLWAGCSRATLLARDWGKLKIEAKHHSSYLWFKTASRHGVKVSKMREDSLFW